MILLAQKVQAAAEKAKQGHFTITDTPYGTTVFEDEYGFTVEFIETGAYISEVCGCGKVTNLFLISSLQKHPLIFTGSEFIIG